jgi:hypothetical protein
MHDFLIHFWAVIAGHFVLEGLLFVATALFGYFFGWRKRVNKFYDALFPVMKQLAHLRKLYKIESKEIQAVVEQLASSFGVAMLGSEDRLRTKRILQRPLRTQKHCEICDASASVDKNDSCTRCNLDCYAWDFETD